MVRAGAAACPVSTGFSDTPSGARPVGATPAKSSTVGVTSIKETNDLFTVPGVTPGPRTISGMRSEGSYGKYLPFLMRCWPSM